MLKKCFLVLCCMILGCVSFPRDCADAASPEPAYSIAPENAELFRVLLSSLENAFEEPSDEDLPHIEALVAQISGNSRDDGFLADAIASHWLHIYLNPDGSYADHLFVWDQEHPGASAEELRSTLLGSCPSLAFIVLGYQLSDGEITEELMGRCEAAAAAARAFPSSVLICTGGATGSNNPDRHTEAGKMKEYLVSVCGIDASRIFTDEESLTTVDNAVNAFEILRGLNIHAVSVVTSDYHQKWGQVLCNAQAALEYLNCGYIVHVVENYSYQTRSRSTGSNYVGTTVSQLTSLLRRYGLGQTQAVSSPVPDGFPGP